MPRFPKISLRACYPGHGKTKIAVCFVVSFFFGISACTEKKKEQKEETAQTPAALAGATKGFELQDLKPLSGSLLRIVERGEVNAPTIGNAILASATSAIASGFSCKETELFLVFQSQGDDIVDSASKTQGVARKVTKCENVRAVLEQKKSEAPDGDTGLSDAFAELKRVLDRYPNFEVSKLSFEGGIPEGSAPKWVAIDALSSWPTQRGVPGASGWQSLSGKFVAVAGFAKDVNTPQGPLSRRIWLPFRVGDQIAGESELIFSLQSWFSEGERSPFSQLADWLAGPDLVVHSAMAFAGVTRYPNVRPLSEILTVSPSSLCFVIQWDENKDAPDVQRFSARCIDSAPFVSLLR